jgi:putative transposase
MKGARMMGVTGEIESRLNEAKEGQEVEPPPQATSSSRRKQQSQTQAAISEQQASSVDVLIIHERGQSYLFDLEIARRREAKRRLAILGETAQQEIEKKQLRALAQSHYLPERVLVSWRHAFRQSGLEGLLPQDWFPLKERSQGEVIRRLKQLGTLRERLDQGKEVTYDDIDGLVKEQKWKTARKAERLVRRYQIDGIWGLAPEHDPERESRKRRQTSPPDLAAVSDEALEVAEQRYALITPYLARRRIPNEELRAYAQTHGLSLETLRKYLRDYRAYSLRGLLPRERSDKGHCHGISLRMEGIIAGIRFSQRDLPLHEVHARATQRARLLSEPEPTLWQVRQVCDQIPEQVKEIADERYGDYRDKHRMTYRFHFDGSVIVYQIDFTPVDVLLKDVRKRSLRTKSEEIRPWLITCVECSSRLVMSYLFTYDTPNSDNIAMVLHDALIVSENKPYGGIPDAVWVDKGKQLISKRMQQIARDLKFDLHEGRPNFSEDRGDPQKRGRVERPFKTFNTRLWSTLRGYTHSNTKERHPDVHGELTISELAAEFRAFIEGKYHREPHSETKQPPLEFWAQHCHPRQASPRDTAFLLPVVGHHAVSKGLIQYGDRRYWHDDLWEVPADAVVEIRAYPKHMRPDEVQVIYDGRWICPASALDSEAGRKVDGKRVLTAQRRQRKAIQQTIDEKKAVLQSADREIEKQKQQEQQLGGDSLGEHERQGQQQAQRHTIQHVVPATAEHSTMTPSAFSTTSKQRTTAWERALAAKERREQEQQRRAQ